MKRAFQIGLAIIIFLTHYGIVQAQTNNAIRQYEEFKQQARKDYNDFRRKCNAEYAEFLKNAWESYLMGPVIPLPKEEPVPPVVMPEDEPRNNKEDNQLPIDTVITPTLDDEIEQPLPVAPIYENDTPGEESFEFTFFGTNGKVRLPRLLETNGMKECNLTKDKLPDAWEGLSDGSYDNLVRDCLELRIRHQLCDWAYLLMLREMSERYYGGRCDAATFLMAWVFCQSGYQMRLVTVDGKLIMLYGTEHHVYDTCCLELDGRLYYPLLHENEDIAEKNLYVCNAAFPEEKPLSLYLNSAQVFSTNMTKTRTIASKRFEGVKADVSVNINLLSFYTSYPSSQIGDNFCTRWEMYANVPMAEEVKKQLYPDLQSFISGKNQIDAANILLNWVQTGFEYEYDDKVWGEDRAFFAEESLYYPYCDCEDRSILFTRLVRDLLGLDCILVYYPGHLAAAVCFNQDVKGDYIMMNRKKFVIADPTYINAPVGYTMPGMNNTKASVILLGR